MRWFYMIIPIIVVGLLLKGCTAKKPGDPGRGETGGSFDHTNHNAPKTITSKQIASFEYTFNTSNLNQFHDRNIPYQGCTFRLEREVDGARYTGVSGGFAGYFAMFNFEFLAPSSSLDDLQIIIDKHNLARVNGVYKGSIGIVEDCTSRLEVKYESGERIFAYDNGGPVLPDVATIELYDYFVTLAKNEKSNLVYSDEEFWELHGVLWGRFKSGDGRKALELQNFEVSIYENEELIDGTLYYIEADKLCNRLDETFTFYKHFVLRNGTLFGVGLDGTEIEFTPEKDNLP